MSERSVLRQIFAIGIFVICASTGYVAGQSLGSGRASHAGGSFTIEGKVYLPDGSPAAGIKVALSSDYTNPTTITDQDGGFIFGGVPAAEYTITVAIEGLPTQTEYRSIDKEAPISQTYYVPIHFRNPGQKKGDPYSSNPLFKDVPQDALAKFKAAFDKMDKNDTAAALPLLEEATTLYPKFAAAHYQKGLILFKSNDIPKALGAFVKAIEIKPDYVDAKYYFGVCHITQRDFPVAEMVFRDILTQKNDMPGAHMYLGIALIAARKNDEAEKELKLATTMKGGENLPLAHKYLGGLYIQKKQNSDAAAELQKYVDLAPKAPDAEKIKGTIADLRKSN